MNIEDEHDKHFMQSGQSYRELIYYVQNVMSTGGNKGGPSWSINHITFTLKWCPEMLAFPCLIPCPPDQHVSSSQRLLSVINTDALVLYIS